MSVTQQIQTLLDTVNTSKQSLDVDFIIASLNSISAEITKLEGLHRAKSEEVETLRNETRQKGEDLSASTVIINNLKDSLKGKALLCFPKERASKMQEAVDSASPARLLELNENITAIFNETFIQPGELISFEKRRSSFIPSNYKIGA